MSEASLTPEQRWLQSQNQHRILFILYFCLLTCCCITPFVYYLRLYLWQRVRLRQLRELEHAGLMGIIQQTMIMNGHERQMDGGESSAARTMIQEERKARIKQMMEPVRKVLESSDFREVDPSFVPRYQDDTAPADGEALVVVTAADKIPSTAEQQGKKNVDPSADQDETSMRCEDETIDGSDEEEDEDDENDQRQVRVPPPGIFLLQQQQQQPPASLSSWLTTLPAVSARLNEPARWVPATCSICISTYEPKSSVVWSSNAECHHVFHAACMEMWLLKQHDDPICPCCRREFLVDPYDLLEQEMERGATANVAADQTVDFKANNTVSAGPPDPPGNERHLATNVSSGTDDDHGFIIELRATTPGEVAQNETGITSVGIGALADYGV